MVIAIIAVLLGLLLPAIQGARQAGKRMQAKSEISQIATAADAFKTDWGAYPPTVFTVPITKVSTDPNFLFLANRYPRWAASIAENAATGLPVPAGGATLTGNQSMVYFLAGPSLTGWAKDQPVAASAGASSKDFYLQADGSKYLAGNAIVGTVSNGYGNANPVYMDPYGLPYQYFGSNKIGGKYTGTVTIGVTTFAPVTDQKTGKFANENGCQIISAGANGPRANPPNGFGNTGTGLWTPGAGAYAEGQAGWDDLANFNGDKQLGVSQ